MHHETDTRGAGAPVPESPGLHNREAFAAEWRDATPEPFYPAEGARYQ